MTEPARTLRVFLSSPGDVSEERALAQQVLKRIGEEYRERVRLEVLLWEHEPLFAHAGFQEQIERPSQCDLVISMLWSRLGTRLPSSFIAPAAGTAVTGTEFEIQDALESYRRIGRPSLLIYRRTVPPEVNLGAADAEERLRQYRLLQEFCRRAFYDDQGAVVVAHHEYAESWEFERKLRAHVRKWLERETGVTAALPRWTAGSPYRGLQSFEAEHREIYFGRSQAVGELTRQLRSVEERAGDGGCRFLLVQGMSGSGKSSLIRAGLLPLLAGGALEGIGSWRQAILKPSDEGITAPGVFGALAERLLSILPELRDHYTPMTLSERLRTAPTESGARLEGYLTQDAGRAGLRAHQVRLVIFVDQLEESWSPAVSATERESLAACLAALSREGRIWVVATLRSDFAANFQSVPDFNGLLKEGRLYVLAAPHGDELGEMIREPALAAGLTWDSKDGVSLDQAILREASANPESLPLLEYALDQLYERRDARRLTFAAYQALGGLSGGIAASAEAVLAEQGAEISQRVLANLLRSLVSVDDTGQATRRYARLTEFTDDSAERALLMRLVERRLCVTDDRGQGAEVSLAHEALLRSSPRLTALVLEESNLLQTRELALHEARQWQQHGRSGAWLAAPDKLAAFEALEQSDIQLPGEVREFIDHSRGQARRNRRIRQAVVGVIAVLAVMASIAAWVAAKRQREAEVQTAQARSSELQLLTESAAQRLKDGNLIFARGIILEVLRRRAIAGTPDPVAMSIFQEIRGADAAGVIFSPGGGMVRAVGFSPDGQRIITGAVDGTASIWDARTGIRLQVLSVHPHVPGGEMFDDIVKSALYSPDGSHILTASSDGTCQVWDARTGTRTAVVLEHIADLSSAAYSRDGARIVTGAGAVQVWEAQTGKLLISLHGPKEGFDTAEFSPDGSRIVAASADGTARVWDVRTGRQVLELTGHDSGVTSASYSPDDRQIVTASRDKTARIWDARSGASLKVLAGHTSQVWHATYAPDGKTIATAGVDATARIWDAATGKMLRLLSGHTEIVLRAAFSPDGKRLVTGGYEGTARVWNLRQGAPWQIFPGAGSGVEFGAEGTQLLTTGADGARVWDLRSGAVLTFMREPDGINRAAYSPDGRRIVALTGRQQLHVWDRVTAARLLVMPTSAEGVMSVAFSPDGRHVLAALDSFSVRTYDAGTGAIVRTIPTLHENYITDAVYSPDASRILTASVDGTARVWDARSFKQLALLSHPDRVRHAVYSRDGGLIVTGDDDSLAHVWDARTGHEIRSLVGHHGSVQSVAVSADSRLIASGSEDGTVRLWETNTGVPLAVFYGHTAAVRDVQLSPDGTQIASAGDDGTVRLWDARVPADGPSQVLWERAVEADPLSEVQSNQFGTSSAVTSLTISALRRSGRRDSAVDRLPGGALACSEKAGAYYDPDGLAPGVEVGEIKVDDAANACAQQPSGADSSGRMNYLAGRLQWARGDFVAARREFESAVSKGYRAARVDLGLLLINADAKMQDPKRAANLFEQAWRSGIPMGGFELAALYERGIPVAGKSASGVPADPSKAGYWCQLAAGQNEPNALARIADRTERLALNGPPERANALLLEAFALYARAAEFARAHQWPQSAWRGWRYRRVSLAHVLADEGKMKEVARAYKQVLDEDSSTR